MATVLVVDDHRDANDILCRLLRMQGHHTASAFTGEEALVSLQEKCPDVVILDFMMPGMDGIETLAIFGPTRQPQSCRSSCTPPLRTLISRAMQSRRGPTCTSPRVRWTLPNLAT